MLPQQSRRGFIKALQHFHDLTPAQRNRYRRAALRTARAVSLENCTEQLEGFYRQLLADNCGAAIENPDAWESIMKKLGAEWNMLSNLANAAGKALTGGSGREAA